MNAVQLSLPEDGGPPGDRNYVELVELDQVEGIWGGRRTGYPDAYGTAVEVIAALSDRVGDDPWLAEVVAALARERNWGRQPGWRRPRLDVIQGRGEMFHATAAVNRESIARHGLDWRRMDRAPGIAGSIKPELPAVFVCDNLFDVGFFVQMARSPSDVWSVRVDGLWVETGPDGWWIISQPIGPERLTLVARDVSELGDDPLHSAQLRHRRLSSAEGAGRWPGHRRGHAHGAEQQWAWQHAGPYPRPRRPRDCRPADALPEARSRSADRGRQPLPRALLSP